MIARASRQAQLLSVPPVWRIDSNAHARNAYGQAAQEIACAALGLEPIPINGNCAICFDAERRCRGALSNPFPVPQFAIFYEIKSVFRRSKVVVYDWRMIKEALSNQPLFYVLVVHNVRGCRDGAGLFQVMAAAGVEIILIPSPAVHILAEQKPLCRIMSERVKNSPGATGYNRAGYCDGYRNVSLKRLRELAMIGEPRTVNFELYEVSFSVRIFS